MSQTNTRLGPLWSPMIPTKSQGQDDLCAVSARGVRIRYADGSDLLCGTSGLWNANLGYGNAAIARAAADALTKASYLSLHQYENTYARQAAAELIEVCGPQNYGRVLFSTSGGAANDLVMKLARQFHVLRGEASRKAVVALEGCWHGLTYGAFALTSDNLGQRMYGVDRRLVVHVPPNNPERLAAMLAKHGANIAMMVVEPVLGTGAIPLTDAYIGELIRLRRQYGFLLVADEVATGFGRTGTFFASENWPSPPDILISSKGLTNGTSACAAVIVSHDVADVFAQPDTVVAHAETQAGTPVTCATILATLSEMRRLDAVARAASLSERLDEELVRLAGEEPLVSGTTGKGCFRSIRLRDRSGTVLPQSEVPTVIAAIRDAGAVVHAAPDGIQLLPALTYGDELAELFGCIRSGLAAYRRGRE
ncbi:daptide-type RiPP biosynthesis aminotransferase [Streptomyces olivaceus]|uniref:daptide-type RiPP biosynthesis aminotransferase n=1 Tax=Streptomyces olivaceus TaxID=47716 RepID=UPI001884A8E2|nr:daptide-type RiPP biosynthesis aminotransferase [Streptomyces olivaceus]